MKRSPIKAKRATPRRREAPRWSWDEWAAAAYVLANRSGGGCERCGTSRGPFERHHRKRRRDGGDSYANLALLCQKCHRECHNDPKAARAAGWIVPTWDDVTTIPVQIGETWWLFDDEGTKVVSDRPVQPDDAITV